MILFLIFIFGFLALAAATNRHRGWSSAIGATVRARVLQIVGWLALSAGALGSIVAHGWPMGSIRAVAVATPAAVLVLLAATYISVPRRTSSGPGTGG